MRYNRILREYPPCQAATRLNRVSTKVRRSDKASPVRIIICWLFVVLATVGCSSSKVARLPASSADRCQIPSAPLLAERLKSIASRAGQPLPGKQLTLAELIDLAQSNNRSTRIAWESARQAAALTGLSRAEYYPMLAVLASYGGGAWDLNIKANNNLSGLENQPGLIGAIVAGALPSDISLNQQASGAFQACKAGAALRWLLLDFGTRNALHKAAISAETASQFAFNAAHQSVVFKVTEAYYALEAARTQTRAAEAASASAEGILGAAEDRFRQGLITEPLLLQARQAKAQADFELANIRAKSEMALVDLAEAAGLEPGTRLDVAEADFSRLGESFREPLENYLSSALRTRPDLLAKVALAQGAEAKLRAAKSESLPKLSLTGIADYSYLDTTVSGVGPLDQLGIGLQTYGGFLNFEWPVFTGFADREKVKTAEAAWKQAEEEVRQSRDKAIAEVWRGYTRSKTSLARRDAAAALLKASRSTYEAKEAGFEQGITPIEEMLEARALYSQASALAAEADQALAMSLVALSYGSGRL